MTYQQRRLFLQLSQTSRFQTARYSTIRTPTLWGRTTAVASVAAAAAASALFASPNPSPIAAMAAFSTTMPAKPHAFLTTPSSTSTSASVLAILDVSELAAEVAATDAARQDAYDASNALKAAIVRAKANVENGNPIPTPIPIPIPPSQPHQPKPDEPTTLHAQFLAVVGPTSSRTPRPANLQYRVEEYVRYQAFLHFLDTGTLLLPPTYATDEEYLAAIMGVAQDLARYGLGRATVRDASSVYQAKTLVQEDILDYLLEFDFRNGPLRRKYDGTKYALKTLETLLYELAVTGTSATDGKDTDMDNKDDAATPPPAPKKAKVEALATTTTTTSITSELTSLRERMEHRDQLRETLIKRCRDGQKAAKQAIYALHRGDRSKAKALMDQCATCIQQDLMPIVEQEPPLRHGSFSNLLEEYAEAKLFYVWLYGNHTEEDGFTTDNDRKKNDDNKAVPQMPPPATVLTPADFLPSIALEPAEYLGGLCDLTGEVGRFAVQRATLRDKASVQRCLHTNKSIWTALQTVPRLPGSIPKKMDQLNRSVEKLERILYELSLSEAAGGRTVQTDATGEGMMDADDKEGGRKDQ